MKTQTNGLFSTINQEQLISLTTTVNETLALDVHLPFHKKMIAADVWNIQRNKRNRAPRRFMF
ncbi:MAG: hypothetical protein QM726_07895 [Chitinophagaceae bacterium]